MKLIRLSQDHFIIVDDSEIKEGDWYFHPNKSINQYGEREIEFMGNDEKICCKKIIHSTEQLEKFTYDNLSDDVFSMDYHNLKPISIQECKELIGEVDVEKKAEKEADKLECDFENPYGSGYFDYIEGYKSGYNQCLEDNQEKKYTEQDMVDFAKKCFAKCDDENFYDLVESEIESLWPKEEWDVEFDENGKLRLKQ